ncbi:MAG: ribbon-helix-helix protein, CopG family [Trueperaceae bacterium]|nr:ribbon-helix-helix protein, CopG family [Trueperaceae bacterium]
MASSQARVNIVLDAEYAEKLRVLADRTHVSPGTLARALLSSALDEADPSARNVAMLLDGIDGAFERAQAGLADIAAGRVIALEDL